MNGGEIGRDRHTLTQRTHARDWVCIIVPKEAKGNTRGESSPPSHKVLSIAVSRDGDGPSEVTGMIVYTRVADSGRAATPP